MTVVYESITLMEPVMPPEGDRQLENLVFNLVAKASTLAGRLDCTLKQPKNPPQPDMT